MSFITNIVNFVTNQPGAVRPNKISEQELNRGQRLMTILHKASPIEIPNGSGGIIDAAILQPTEAAKTVILVVTDQKPYQIAMLDVSVDFKNEGAKKNADIVCFNTSGIGHSSGKPNQSTIQKEIQVVKEHLKTQYQYSEFDVRYVKY